MVVLWLSISLPVCAAGRLEGKEQDMKIHIRLAPVVRVELDVFSGEPNPSWTLTNQEREELVSKLSDLETTSSSERRQSDSSLGYRGFLLSSGTEDKDASVSVRIGDGLVRYQEGGKVAYWRDMDQRVERWLVSLARPRVGAKAYDAITQMK
jgi:hypothetical protein